MRGGAGTILALDLATGHVLWRAGAGLRPLAIVKDALVTARIVKPSAIELTFLHTADGRVLRISKPVPLPDWAVPSLDDTPEFTLRAEVEGPTVIVRWLAQTRYQGGAPPSAMVRGRYEHDAHGAVRVSVESGDVELVDESGDAGAAVEQPMTVALDSNVIDQREIGDKRFELVTEKEAGGTVKVLIRAVGLANRQPAWEAVIDEVPLRRPKPLRP